MSQISVNKKLSKYPVGIGASGRPFTRPKELYVLDNVYHLISLAAMGAILAVWV